MRKFNLLGTGHLFEEELLGQCLYVWDGSYLPYQESMEVVKTHQPASTSRPSCPVARTLHRQIAMKLGVAEWTELMFFTAVKSPLDLWHGVDGLFEWDGIVVTIDVTMNPTKTEGKADIVYHQGDGLDWLINEVVERFTKKREGRLNV